MKKNILHGLVLVSMTIMPAAAFAAETQLRANIWPRTSHNLVSEVLMPWIEKIEEATDGRVVFEIPAAPLAGGKGMYDAVAGGVAHVSFAIQGYTPARFPYSRVAEFPFTGDSATSVSVAFWRTFQTYFADKNIHRHVKLLGLFSHGPGQLWTTNKPITGINDLERVKMRTGGGFQREVARLLGAVMVAAEAPKNYEILSRGTADGTFLPMDSIYKYKISDIVNYQTRFQGGLYNTGFMVIMNEDRWRAIDPRDQEIVEAVSGENIARLAGRSWDRLDNIGKRKIAEDEITVIRADEKFLDAIRKRVRPLEEEWIALMESKYGADGEAALEFMRAEAARIDAALEEGKTFEPWPIETPQ